LKSKERPAQTLAVSDILQLVGFLLELPLDQAGVVVRGMVIIVFIGRMAIEE
jgi:hypothetical protein